MTTNLPPPRKKIARVLHALITQDEIKEFDFRLNSFRRIISDLKRPPYDLEIRDKEKEDVDEYGHPVRFKVRYLWKRDIPGAVRIYKKMNQA